MSLAPGTRLGPYEVISPLGAGGMGEVYRAKDTRLDRDVAVKVLPALMAGDPDRRARFEREAKAVAALSHPNILAIHDVGAEGGVAYAVTELLQGQTLRERLTAGAIPVRKTIEYAVQMARGLAAAHDKGLVHRDLKPENVFLLEDGQVRILDFGLARPTVALDGSGAETMGAMTDPGTVMGTVGYMAPEQVRGQAVDARTDLFALGAVLYEMLAGRRAFQRETAAETMTAILKEDPPERVGSRADISPALDRIVRHCLEKNPTERFQTARDVAFSLESLSESASASSSGPAPVFVPARARPKSASMWLAAAASGAVLLAAGWFGGRALVPSAAHETATWVSMAPPHGRFARSPAPAISPDGTEVAFWAPDERGEVGLWVRRFDAPNARRLPGTVVGDLETSENTDQPFWAPDGRALGFFADGKLKRITLDGGAPQTLADAPSPRGGSWGRAGQILFMPVSGGAVYTIPEAGGAPVPVRIEDPERRPLQFPHFLPDSRHFLLSSINGGIFLCRLDDPAIRKVAEARSRAEYARGHLFFEHDGGLYAQPFDLASFATSGASIRVSDRVGYTYGSPINRSFSVSSAGRLVFGENVWQPLTELAWFNRSGALVGRVGQRAETMGIVMSSDRTRALVERHDPRTNLTGPWSVDLTAGTETRVASSQVESIEISPIWSADESRIFFSTLRGIFSRDVRGGQVVRLVEQDRAAWLNDRSSDGKVLLFEKGDPVTRQDVWVLTLGSPPAARPHLASKYSESQAVLSPDARAIAYVSDESGRSEVYVDAFPQPQAKTLVSVGGGTRPEWRPDGRELYYIGPDQVLMAVAVEMQAGQIRMGRPVRLFQLSVAMGGANRHQYQPTANGDRFLVNVRAPLDVDPPVTVLLNWPAVTEPVESPRQ